MKKMNQLVSVILAGLVLTFLLVGCTESENERRNAPTRVKSFSIGNDNYKLDNVLMDSRGSNDRIQAYAVVFLKTSPTSPPAKFTMDSRGNTSPPVSMVDLTFSEGDKIIAKSKEIRSQVSEGTPGYEGKVTFIIFLEKGKEFPKEGAIVYRKSEQETDSYLIDFSDIQFSNNL